MKKILVTGATGFIGSTFVRRMLKSGLTPAPIVGTYRSASSLRVGAQRLGLSALASDDPRFHLKQVELTRNSDVSGLMEDVEYVVHFAAKTFVDHSIRDAQPFIESNVVGTFNLLEEARRYGGQIKKFIYVSTDEVYGSILKGEHTEESPLNPSNPYAATKAAGEMLALSYQKTYGLPVLVTRTENNHGPYQHQQKAIPTFVRAAMRDENLPIYGDGLHERMWLHVDDHCTALHLLMKSDATGIYNIAGKNAMTNVDLAALVIATVGKGGFSFVDDHNIRPGHDRRYAISSTKLREQLPMWNPMQTDVGLKSTIAWYMEHSTWEA